MELVISTSLPKTYNAPPSLEALQSVKVVSLIIILSPVMNIAPPSILLMLEPSLYITLPEVIVELVILTLSPVSEMVPPLELESPLHIPVLLVQVIL